MLDHQVIIQKSSFPGKTQTPLQRISHAIIGSEFPAKKDGNNFHIPATEVFKVLEFKDSKSKDLEWLQKRLSTQKTVVIKCHCAKIKKEA